MTFVLLLIEFKIQNTYGSVFNGDGCVSSGSLSSWSLRRGNLSSGFVRFRGFCFGSSSSSSGSFLIEFEEFGFRSDDILQHSFESGTKKLLLVLLPFVLVYTVTIINVLIYFKFINNYL